jgi:uncharacterized membrane protein
VVFALAASFGEACVGFVDEWMLSRLKRPDDVDSEATGTLILVSSLFGFVVSGFAALYIVLNDNFGFAAPREAYAFGLLAGLIDVAWLVPYFLSINRGGALSVTPLLQTIPIFALILGVFFFDEIPSLVALLAGGLIVTGGLFLNHSKATNRLDLISIGLMLLSSALISIGLFFFKEAERAGSIPLAIFANALGMGLTGSLMWCVWPPFRRQFNRFVRHFDRRILFGQFANEFLYSGAAIAGQIALVLGPSVMIVTAFNAFHPIFTLLIGSVLARLGSAVHAETLDRSQRGYKILGILLVALGAGLIVF